MATISLTSADIPSVGSASAVFGSDNALLVARPSRACCNYLWFTVPEGFYALVTRHGADEDYDDGSPVWPPGLHLGPPWLKVSHLVTRQAVVMQTPVQGCKTKDNVTVGIDICLVLRVMGDDPKSTPGDDPHNVRKFVHMVTARGLQQQLQDAQAEAVRNLARSVTHTEVFGLRSVSGKELAGVTSKIETTASSPYTTMEFGSSNTDNNNGGFEETKEEIGGSSTERDMMGDHDAMDEMEADFATETGANVAKVMKDRLNKQFMTQGVQILDVIIENITLPNEIQTQMSQKTMVISQNAEQRMQQKHDMLVLEQSEAIKSLKQAHIEQKLEAREDGQQKAQIEELEYMFERSVGMGVVERMVTQMIIDVEAVAADSNIAVQRIRDTTKLEVQRVELEAEAQSVKEYADVHATVMDMDAKAELTCSRLSARGDNAVFAAEGTIAPKMKVFNDYTTDMRKLDVQESLAGNSKLVVTGLSGGEAANQLILADAALGGVGGGRGGISGEERSRLLSELAVAGGRAAVKIHVGGGAGC